MPQIAPSSLSVVRRQMIPLRLFQLNQYLAVLSLIAATSSSSPLLCGEPNHDEATSQGQQLFEWTFPAMGTTMAFQAYSSDAQQVEIAFKDAKRHVDQITSILSDYEDDSETVLLTQASRLNVAQKVSEEMWQVLLMSNSYQRLSNGKFDPSVGSLTRLWRSARRAKRIPSTEEVETARSNTGWSNLRFDVEQKLVTVVKANLHLDFGGIAKGWVVDQAFQRLVEHGLTSSLVRAGGDIRCGDAPPRKTGWTVLVGPLAGEKVFLKSMLLCNRGIATSGDLWQFQEVDGVRRSHIIDPTTGYGVSGPISATVVAPTAADADALATIVCLMGPQQGCRLVQSIPNCSGFVSRVQQDSDAIEYTSTENFSRK